jgi:2,3-dihydroxyphenylpropionate 1,2-dioxygenase
MVGHGWSDLPDKPYTIDVLSDHLLGLMDALGIGSAHLSGESLGGWVVAWTAAHHPDRVERLVLNTPGNIANKPEVMVRMRESTLAAVRDPSDETVRRRVEFLFHHKEMVTDELVNLRRAVYSRPGFLQAITNTLVLQDPEVRKDFAWDPGWVGQGRRADAAAVDRQRPDRRSRRGGAAAALAARRPAARDHRRGPLAAVGEAGRVPARPPRLPHPRQGPGMSEIIGLVGMSHSPFATMTPPSSPEEPGGRFLADAARVAEAVARLAPDAIVVIGPDHFHANFYDQMPPFVLGVEQAVGFGDFGSRSGPAAGRHATGLVGARRARRGRFRPVAVLRAHPRPRSDVQSYEMVRGARPIPLVPLIVNTAAPPLPSMPRCVELGRALGAAIRGADFPGRVLVVASGGLSHWLPSNDPRDPAVAGPRRESVIHGRANVQAVAATREPLVRAMGGNPNAHVNSAWDAGSSSS